MGVIDPLKDPPSALTTCSEHLKFNQNDVHRYFPKIISCLPLSESSTRNFYVTTFIVLSSGKEKSTLTL